MVDGQQIDSIRANRLFAGTAQKLKISISKKELLSAGAGTLIYRQNDDADSVYLIIEGEIKLEVSGIFKKPVVVKKAANDFFGEKEYLERVNRKGNALAATDCRLCILKKDKIDDLILQDKRIFANLYGLIDESPEIEEPGKEREIIPQSPPEEDERPIPENDVPAPGEEITPVDLNLKDIPGLDDTLLEIQLQELLEPELPQYSDAEILKWAEEIEAAVHPVSNTEDDVKDQTADSIETDLPEAGSEKVEPGQDILVGFDFLKEIELLKDSPEEEEVINFDLIDENEALFDNEQEVEETHVITSESPEPEPVIPEKTETAELNEEIPGIDIPVEEFPVSATPEEDINAGQAYTDDLDGLFVRRTEEINLASVEVIPAAEEKPEIVEQKPEIIEVAQTAEEIIFAPEVVPEITEPEEAEEYPEQINELSEEVDEMTAAKFKQLLEAAQKINSSIKLDETLESVLTAARNLTGAEHGYLYVVDRESNELWAKALSNEIHKEVRVKMGEDIAGICAEKGIVINLKDAYKDKRFNQARDKTDGLKTKSLLCVPILNKTGFVSAVLQLTNSSSGEFTKSDEEALGALSVNISLALENAELVEKQLQTDRVSSMGKMANFLIQDIKKPVLTIKYYAEHIKKKEVAPDVVQILNMLIDQSNAVVDLVQTTLSYSEGKGLLRAQPLRLSGVLDDIFHLLAEYVESRHVNLFKKYEADAVVNIDKREFYQACFQIVKNACDAMPKGGDIYVLVKSENGVLKIEFKDSGVGIPESIKPKIFEPFMSHGKKQGVGLGLSIAEKIVKDHSGEITFESEIGEGTTFIISLPYISLV